jgi:hypothetical protein
MSRSPWSYALATLVVAFASLLLLIQPGVQAAKPAMPVPPIMQLGFDACAKEGVKTAIGIWTKGTFNEDKEYLNKLVETFAQFEEAAGKFRSVELLATQEVAANSRLVYYEMDYERGAMFARFLLYKTELGWTVQAFTYNLSPDVIMPWLWLNMADGKQSAAGRSPN